MSPLAEWCSGRWQGLLGGVLLCLTLIPAMLSAQVIGDDAEMARLRMKDEEAMANDDPDGAAMTMGRAAVMAAQLAKKRDGFGRQVYKANAALFRSQEHAYRAMALFQRAGGQLPASSGVCGSLTLAHGSLEQAAELVSDSPIPTPPDPLTADAARLRESADNWSTVIESMIDEYQCP